jgi:hypothetical protein
VKSAGFTFAVLLLLSLGSRAADPKAAPTIKATPEQVTFFETKIRPVLAENCYKCHSTRAKKVKAGLLIDSRARLLKGGDSGPVIVPSNPEKSLLYKGISYIDSDFAMPPKKKLPAHVIENLRKWIAMGAPWPKEEVPQLSGKESWNWEEERQSHWAWQPIRKVDPPKVNNPKWPRNGIDHFIMARLQAKGMQPNGPADKRAQIRRVYLDMLGLPPTPAQVREFADGRKDWNGVIEDVLASPHYGERWARHWLDVARYSHGFGGFLDNKASPQAWRYQMWVIRMFNNDLPINEFIKRQVAGDVMDAEKHAVATGFFALGPKYNSDGGDPDSNAMAQIETLDDLVDTLGRGLMGITLGCARCHDHKFDPVPTMDYYSIAGIFKNSRVADHPIAPKSEIDAYNAALKAHKDKQNEFNKANNEARAALQKRALPNLAKYLLAAEEFSQLKKKPNHADWARERGLVGSIFQKCQGVFAAKNNGQKIGGLDEWYKTKSEAAAKKFAERINAMHAEREKTKKDPADWKTWWNPLARHFQTAGDHKRDLAEAEQKKLNDLQAVAAQLQKAIPPKYSTAHVLREGGSNNMKIALRGNLRKPGPEAPRRFLRLFGGEDTQRFTRGSGRLELAEAVVAENNPLPARVFVNRIWKWHFGRGLIRTPSNLGKLGLLPTHPELLDWLAATFTGQGWSLKELHRLILRSATYQMSSQYDAESFAKDGANKLLWRMSPRKLEVEAWRDTLLFVSGELKTELKGEPFDNLTGDFRRTQYAQTSRNGDKFKSDAFLRLFDFPTPRTSISRRIPTITPQQSLFMLNNAFVIGRAKALAARLDREAPHEEARVKLAYEILFARQPSESELKVGVTFLKTKDSEGEKPSLTRPQRYAQALLVASEFFWVE